MILDQKIDEHEYFALFAFKPFANESGLLINDINLQKKRNWKRNMTF